MKTNLNNCFHTLLVTGLLMTPPLALSACADEEIQHPEVTVPMAPELGPEGADGDISFSDVETYTAFTSHTEANSTRIPAIVTAKDGSLLVFCEGRHDRWNDRSYTNVLVKRSTDGGKTWSASTNLTGSINPAPAKTYAFMDPTPVADLTTGKVFLFCTRWLVGSDEATQNRQFMVVSEDNGATWGAPQDVTSQVIRSGMYSGGFGPSSGIQISKGRYAGRMIMPSRQTDGNATTGVIVYSDDHGATWKNDGTSATIGEAQIAEAGVNKLTMNIRRGTDRYSTTSTDGGITWTVAAKESGLPSFAAFAKSGCHASVFGTGSGIVLYCGPKSGPAIAGHDNRFDLTLYRSPLGGGSWTRNQQLTTLAAGYPDMTQLQDGRVAIAYEAGPEKGFINIAGGRPAGWMRVDVIILPKEILDYGYWFEKQN